MPCHTRPSGNGFQGGVVMSCGGSGGSAGSPSAIVLKEIKGDISLGPLAGPLWRNVEGRVRDTLTKQELPHSASQVSEVINDSFVCLKQQPT